ncbi:MAG: hypothetical protein OEZ22_09665 [Spirochaetia bacterium]|nr:hypothetical protein [Spirochaetia bacterium]
MKKYKLILIFLLAILALFSNCLYYSTNYLAGYEPNVRPLKENTVYEVLGKSEAVASNYNLFWLFTITPRPDINRAIDDAVQQKNGDELIDVSWINESEYWVVGTIEKLIVKGKVIKYKE